MPAHSPNKHPPGASRAIERNPVVAAIAAVSVALLAPALGQRSLPGDGSYEVADVEEGGSVGGFVRLRGPAPELPRLPITKNQAICGRDTKDPSLQLGPGGGVAGAVVYLAGVTRGKPFPPSGEPPTLDQRDCVYVPHLQMVPLGASLAITNSDPFLHNVHAYLNGTETLFNIATPVRGFRIHRRLERPGIVSIKCDAGHTWMSAYIMVQPHPYYAISGADGGYAIGDIAPGEYRLRLWHELLGEQERTITMGGSRRASVDFDLEWKP